MHPEWDLTFRYGVCPEGDAAKNIGTDPESSADIYMTSNESIPDLLQDGSIVELGGIWADKIRETNTETAVQIVTYEGGIYADGTIVGYVLVIYDYDVPEYDIWHMMIDESKQGRGYGSAALDRVIDYIRTKPFGSSDRVTLTCNKDNPHAQRLYRAKDFVETGAEDDDEIELSLTLG